MVSIRSHETLRQLIASKKNGTHLQVSHDKKFVIKIIAKNDMKVLQDLSHFHSRFVFLQFFDSLSLGYHGRQTKMATKCSLDTINKEFRQNI